MEEREVKVLDYISEKRFDLGDVLQKLERLEAVINVMARHIEVLEKRNKKFTDRFRFGKFKFKELKDELPNIKIEKRVNFSLNDD